MIIANRLKLLREKKGVNKKELSVLLNLPYTTYVNYEAGTREPGSNVLRTISNFYDVSIDYILGITENPEKNKTNVRDEITDPNYGKASNNTEEVEEKQLYDIDKPIIDKFLKLTDRNKYRIESKIDDYLIEQDNNTSHIFLASRNGHTGYVPVPTEKLKQLDKNFEDGKYNEAIRKSREEIEDL